MRISDSFKNTQKKVFQDKTVSHRALVKTTGSLGSVTTGPGSVSATYSVNFQLLQDAVLAQEWGLVLARDAMITSSDFLPINHGDFIQYGGSVYKVVGKPVHDSHTKLMLQLTTEAVV